MDPVRDATYVAVVGSGTATGELYEKAREVGKLVAERGGIIVCGGLSGVMEAAARGVKEAGGTSIGILPDEGRRGQNEYLTYSVATGTGQARNLAVVCSGDVVIAIGGEYGTLSEIGLARKVGRHVVVLESWDIGEHVSVASSPQEAVEMAFGPMEIREEEGVSDTRSEIQEIVDRETRGWDTQDVDLLLSVFHPDMVWPWPRTPKSHDPMEWRLVLGRYDPERWGNLWRELFDTHELVHNDRETRKIEVSEEGDGALAVVDIDTLWRSAEGSESHWKGRVCKVYSRVQGEWKMTMHTGVLEYSQGAADLEPG